MFFWHVQKSVKTSWFLQIYTAETTSQHRKYNPQNRALFGFRKSSQSSLMFVTRKFKKCQKRWCQFPPKIMNKIYVFLTKFSFQMTIATRENIVLCFLLQINICFRLSFYSPKWCKMWLPLVHGVISKKAHAVWNNLECTSAKQLGNHDRGQPPKGPDPQQSHPTHCKIRATPSFHS